MSWRVLSCCALGDVVIQPSPALQWISEGFRGFPPLEHTCLAPLDVTLVVIDTPPHTAVTLPTITALATALLLPCRLTAFDLTAMPATVALARAAHTPTAFVRTACPRRAPEVAEAAAALAT